MANPRPLVMLAITTLGIWVVNCNRDRMGSFKHNDHGISGDIHEVVDDEGTVQENKIRIRDFYLPAKGDFFAIAKKKNFNDVVYALHIFKHSSEPDPTKVEVDGLYYLPNSKEYNCKYPELDLDLEGIKISEIGWVIVYNMQFNHLLAQTSELKAQP